MTWRARLVWNWPTLGVGYNLLDPTHRLWAFWLGPAELQVWARRAK